MAATTKTKATKSRTSARAQIRPLADRALVRVMEEQQAKRGGIIIPDTAKETPQEGEVIVVGPGKLNEEGQRMPLEIRPGDRIVYAKYAGTEVTVDGEEFLIIREADILAVL